MKTFRVAVAVAVVLALICVQFSSAVPVTEDMEEPMSNDDPAAGYEGTSEDSWRTVLNIREKRDLKFCCPDCYPECFVCCKPF